MTDDPDFFAWLDGELPEPAASAMAARVAADPTLASFAEQHRALSVRLSSAFAPIAAQPVPERVRVAASDRPAEVIDFAAARSKRRGWSVQGLALAASLALGVTIGALLPTGDGDSFRQQDGRLLAAGALDRSLSTQLASVGSAAGTRIGLSFRDPGGRYCRTFTQQSASGLACRSDGRWAIEGLVAGDSNGDYRMASGIDPVLGTLVDQRLAGDPLDEAGEKAARDRGWR